MLLIEQIYEANDVESDNVKCPVCKHGRLCDKPVGDRAMAIAVSRDSEPRSGTRIILKCPKCAHTMGTETTQDDVIIVADPYDTADHNQDGYGIYSAEWFLYNFTFYNFFSEESGEHNDMCFLVAKPA